MKVYVYYSDDTGYGLEEFETRERAAAFIEKRMSMALKPNMANYTVIEGVPLETRAVSVVTRVTFASRTGEQAR